MLICCHTIRSMKGPGIHLESNTEDCVLGKHPPEVCICASIFPQMYLLLQPASCVQVSVKHHPSLPPTSITCTLPKLRYSCSVAKSRLTLCNTTDALRIRWPKDWSFSFSIRPSSEYSGLISLRIDRFDLLAVQGTLKSLLQHHSSKASTLQCSAFLTVQLSHPYMTTGKTIALTRCTFVSKVMCPLCNTLSRFILSCGDSCHYCCFLPYSLVCFSLVHP